MKGLRLLIISKSVIPSRFISHRNQSRMSWFWNGKCTSTARLDGKTAIVTGCNTGIGIKTVEDFAKRGCRVIMACRDLQKAQNALDEVSTALKEISNKGTLIIKKLDLASLASVRTFADDILKEYDQIHLLINNAGVMTCPELRTEDGFEMQFGTNHLGHFLLTLLLLPRIINSAPARIVNVSSRAHNYGDINFDDLFFTRNNYSATRAYAQSKLANVLFTRELAKRLAGTGVTVYSLHPGVVRTELSRHFNQTFFPGFRAIARTAMFLFKTPQEGAQTTIYCAVDEKTAQETGLYYSDCRPVAPSSKALNDETAAKLWDVSLELVGIERDPTEKTVSQK